MRNNTSRAKGFCLMLIGSNAGYNDEVLFSALEGVHTADLHRLVQRWLQRSLSLHDGDNVPSLAFVGCDHAYLPGAYARLQ